MNERRYRTLRDDSAGDMRWLNAAREIVLSGNVSFAFATRPRQSPPPLMQGEELRARRDPSVSELLTRRIADIVRASDPLRSNYWKLRFASELAFILARWDSKAALPVLRSIMPKCREMIELKRKGDANTSSWPSRDLAQLTVIRAEVGDREALDEYAAWIRTAVPKELEDQGIECWEPISSYPDHPRIAEVARWLFNDPASPFVPLLRASGGWHRSLLRQFQLRHITAPHGGRIPRRPDRRDGWNVRDRDGPPRWARHDRVQDERRSLARLELFQARPECGQTRRGPSVPRLRLHRLENLVA